MVVRMAMNAVWLKMEEQYFVQALQQAAEKLDGVTDEVVLDFSSVRRIDSSALGAIEEFATVAEGKNLTVVLLGVSVGVYKVLKLVNVASRFSFAN
jgi:anti-anti-sigma regulatory factor